MSTYSNERIEEEIEEEAGHGPLLARDELRWLVGSSVCKEGPPLSHRELRRGRGECRKKDVEVSLSNDSRRAQTPPPRTLTTRQSFG